MFRLIASVLRLVTQAIIVKAYLSKNGASDYSPCEVFCASLGYFVSESVASESGIARTSFLQ